MQDFSRHLKEAINLNSERLQMYATLTNGRSVYFSKKLIRLERMVLYWAWIFDRKGDKLQAKGIPYMKEEFVEMSLTPDFSSHYPKEIDFRVPLQIVSIKLLTKRIKQQLRDQDFEGIVISCQTFLKKELDEQPHVYCMLRHMLESICLISSLVPIQSERCLKLGMKAPTNYSVLLLKAHCWYLERARKFDQELAPIQLEGVPFLFQDLPRISL